MENKKITPRKELFIAIKKALMEIPELELIDLDRGQMSSEHFPHLFVSALINIKLLVQIYRENSKINKYF